MSCDDGRCDPRHDCSTTESSCGKKRSESLEAGDGRGLLVEDLPISFSVTLSGGCRGGGGRYRGTVANGVKTWNRVNNR